LSVHRETKRDGTVVYRVRWREGGRGTAQPFDLEEDARDFDRRVRRLKQTGDPALLADEITLREYILGELVAQLRRAPARAVHAGTPLNRPRPAHPPAARRRPAHAASRQRRRALRRRPRAGGRRSRHDPAALLPAAARVVVEHQLGDIPRPVTALGARAIAVLEEDLPPQHGGAGELVFPIGRPAAGPAATFTAQRVDVDVRGVREIVPASASVAHVPSTSPVSLDCSRVGESCSPIQWSRRGIPPARPACRPAPPQCRLCLDGTAAASSVAPFAAPPVFVQLSSERTVEPVRRDSSFAGKQASYPTLLLVVLTRSLSSRAATLAPVREELTAPNVSGGGGSYNSPAAAA
jgi:hypothetical protein